MRKFYLGPQSDLPTAASDTLVAVIILIVDRESTLHHCALAPQRRRHLHYTCRMSASNSKLGGKRPSMYESIPKSTTMPACLAFRKAALQMCMFSSVVDHNHSVDKIGKVLRELPNLTDYSIIMLSSFNSVDLIGAWNTSASTP